MKNIAIIGSRPETWEECKKLDRRSWELWRFSRKNYEKPPKADKWFELHHPCNFERYERQKPGYGEFLKGKNVVLYEDFPFEEILEEFGPYFFGHGQAPWMIAHAITLKPKEIKLFGMEPDQTYGPQKREIQHWMAIARERGIKITAPVDQGLHNYDQLYALEVDWVNQSNVLRRLRESGVEEHRIERIQRVMSSDDDNWVKRMHEARKAKYGSATAR